MLSPLKKIERNKRQLINVSGFQETEFKSFTPVITQKDKILIFSELKTVIKSFQETGKKNTARRSVRKLSAEN